MENKSYLSRDGDQWYWNVELADRIGVWMPHWIPSDNLGLRVLYYFNDERVKSFRENESLKKYLAALPDSIGTGNYTFKYQMPVKVGQPGKYYFDSYIAEVVDYELISYCCDKAYRFTVDDLTGINEVKSEEVKSEKWAGTWYTLDGRKIENSKSSDRKLSKGIYIRNGKKVLVK